MIIRNLSTTGEDRALAHDIRVRSGMRMPLVDISECLHELQKAPSLAAKDIGIARVNRPFQTEIGEVLTINHKQGRL